MNLKISYQNNTYTSENIKTHEEFVTDLKNQIPFLDQLTIWFINEKGEKILISNTSELEAIANLDKIALQLDATIDQAKKEEAEKKKEKVEEIKKKQRLEQKMKKLEQIEKEKLQLFELEKEMEILKEKNNQEIEELDKVVQTQQEASVFQLPDISEVLTQSKIAEAVKEKEAQLLQLEGKKEFDIHLKTMEKDIQTIFHQIYAARAHQFQVNYAQWKQNQAATNKAQIDECQIKKRFIQQYQQLKERINYHEKLIKQYLDEVQALE